LLQLTKLYLNIELITTVIAVVKL